jgi:hypothetical protein
MNSFIHFPAHHISPTPKQLAPLERTWNFGLETAWTFTFRCYLFAISALKETVRIQAGMLIGMYAAHTTNP